MAQKVILVDDLDGTEDDSVQTETFTYKGIPYEIDLSGPNRAKLDKALKPFTEHARAMRGLRMAPKPSGGSVRREKGSGGTRDDYAAIRAWLTGQGHDVAPKGRIAAHLIELYDNAHSSAKAG